jgi:hypothetical protein
MAGEDVPTLEQLLNRSLWMDRAAFRGSDTLTFFIERGDYNRQGRGCP